MQNKEFWKTFALVLGLLGSIPGILDIAEGVAAMLGPEWQWWNYTLLIVCAGGLLWIWVPKLVGLFARDAERKKKPSAISKAPGKAMFLFRMVWRLDWLGYYNFRPKHFSFMFRKEQWEDDTRYELRPTFRALLLPFWMAAHLAYALYLCLLFVLPFAVIALVVDAIFGFRFLGYMF